MTKGDCVLHEEYPQGYPRERPSYGRIIKDGINPGRFQVEFPTRKTVSGTNVKTWCAKSKLRVVPLDEYNSAMILET